MMMIIIAGTMAVDKKTRSHTKPVKTWGLGSVIGILPAVPGNQALINDDLFVYISFEAHASARTRLRRICNLHGDIV